MNSSHRRKSMAGTLGQGLEVTTNNNLAEFVALIRNETAIWAGVIKEAGIKAE